MSKPAGNIRLQIAGISTLVHQVRRPNANQPLEDSLAQRRLTFLDILEFFAISCIADVGETPKETIYVVLTQQLVDRGYKDM